MDARIALHAHGHAAPDALVIDLLREALEEGEIRDVLVDLEAVLGSQTGHVRLGQRGSELNDRGLPRCFASSDVSGPATSSSSFM